MLDHNGLASTAHRVDAFSPEFASAQVSSDGAQVAVTFNESIESPAILRAFGVQTSLLQSLTLDVWVDGELAARSDAALSGGHGHIDDGRTDHPGPDGNRLPRQPLHRDGYIYLRGPPMAIICSAFTGATGDQRVHRCRRGPARRGTDSEPDRPRDHRRPDRHLHRGASVPAGG